MLCVEGAEAWLLSARAVQSWRLSGAEGPQGALPQWGRGWRLPEGAASLRSLSCRGAEFVALDGAGRAWRAPQEANSPADDAQVAGGAAEVGAGSPAGGAQGAGGAAGVGAMLVPGAAPEGAGWRAGDAQVALEGGAVGVVTSWGFGVRGGPGAEDWLFWRRAAAQVQDATVHAGDLWLVAESGLWRVRPGRGEAQPVALPPKIADEPLARVFADGPFLWVGTQGGWGYPLRVAGLSAQLMPRDGQLLPEDDGLMLPLGAGLLVGARGQAGLGYRPRDAQTAQPLALGGFEREPLRALLFVSARQVLAASDAQIVLIGLGARGLPEVQHTRAIEGTVRLFSWAGQIWGVSAGEGVFSVVWPE